MRKSSLIKKNHGQKIMECIGHFICLLGKKSKYKAVFFLLFFSPFFERCTLFYSLFYVCLKSGQKIEFKQLLPASVRNPPVPTVSHTWLIGKQPGHPHPAHTRKVGQSWLGSNWPKSTRRRFPNARTSNTGRQIRIKISANILSQERVNRQINKHANTPTSKQDNEEAHNRGSNKEGG